VTAGLRDLFASTRGIFCVLLVALCTVFFALGKLSADQWLEFVKWATVSLLASKTIEIASGKISGAPPPAKE